MTSSHDDQLLPGRSDLPFNDDGHSTVKAIPSLVISVIRLPVTCELFSRFIYFPPSLWSRRRGSFFPSFFHPPGDNLENSVRWEENGTGDSGWGHFFFNIGPTFLKIVKLKKKNIFPVPTKAKVEYI